MKRVKKPTLTTTAFFPAHWSAPHIRLSHCLSGEFVPAHGYHNSSHPRVECSPGSRHWWWPDRASGPRTGCYGTDSRFACIDCFWICQSYCCCRSWGSVGPVGARELAGAWGCTRRWWRRWTRCCFISISIEWGRIEHTWSTWLDRPFHLEALATLLIKVWVDLQV